MDDTKVKEALLLSYELISSPGHVAALYLGLKKVDEKDRALCVQEMVRLRDGVDSGRHKPSTLERLAYTLLTDALGNKAMERDRLTLRGSDVKPEETGQEP